MTNNYVPTEDTRVRLWVESDSVVRPSLQQQVVMIALKV